MKMGSLLPRSNFFRSLGHIEHSLEKLWNEPGVFLSQVSLPCIDLKDNDKAFILSIEVPGIKKEDICVDLDKNSLTISAEKKYEERQENERMYSSEINYGTFARFIQLPTEIEPDEATAEYKDGVLKINLPKAKEASLKKRLEVK